MPPFCFGRGAMRFAAIAQASKTDKALILVITPFGIGKHRNLRLFCATIDARTISASPPNRWIASDPPLELAARDKRRTPAEQS